MLSLEPGGSLIPTQDTCTQIWARDSPTEYWVLLTDRGKMDFGQAETLDAHSADLEKSSELQTIYAGS